MARYLWREKQRQIFCHSHLSQRSQARDFCCTLVPDTVGSLSLISLLPPFVVVRLVVDLLLVICSWSSGVGAVSKISALVTHHVPKNLNFNQQDSDAFCNEPSKRRNNVYEAQRRTNDRTGKQKRTLGHVFPNFRFRPDRLFCLYWTFCFRLKPTFVHTTTKTG